MTKTVDEYITHAAHEQAEKKYHQAMDNMQQETRSLLAGAMVYPDPHVYVSMGDKDKIIDELAESIEINMKNKLVEMLVDNDDR